MKKEEREQLKEYLMEIDPCIEFDVENEEKLIGYAERFGCHFIPLYEGINTFLINDPEEAVNKAEEISTFPVFVFPGLESSLVGYVVFDGGKAAILYDKEKYLDDLAKEYEEDGMEIDEECESYYGSALEWYDYNVIGTGLSDMTTPAFACTEEFPLPVT